MSQLCAISASFLITISALQAQQATAPAAVSSISLNVVVNDRSGQPVSGLTKQDFTLLVNKESQPIQSFSVGNTEPVGVVLVLDSVNTPFTRMAYAQDQVAKFLRLDGGKLARPVSMAFLSDTGIEMQAAPTLDGNALAALITQHQSALHTIKRSQGVYGASDRVDLSLRALSQIAEKVETRPGRTLLVWISPGWPLLSGPRIELTPKQEQSIFDTLVATSTLLRQARVSLYAVDPLGTSDSVSFRTFGYEQYMKGVSTPNQVQLGNLALGVLAVQSGGRVLNSSNDIAGEIRTCLRDVGASYRLTFDSPPTSTPNSYRAIDIEVDRPGLKAQTRTGYYAQPVSSASQ